MNRFEQDLQQLADDIDVTTSRAASDVRRGGDRRRTRDRVVVLAATVAAVAVTASLLSQDRTDAPQPAPDPSPGTCTPLAVPAAIPDPFVYHNGRIPGREELVTLDGSELSSVAADPATFVAGGTAKLGGVPLWYSTDATTWDQVDDVVGTVPRRISHLAAAESGFVAVGRAQGLPGAWVSPDGRHWAQAQTPSDDRVVVGGVAISTLGFFAYGLEQHGRDGWDAVIWRSGDACTWRRVGDPAELDGDGDQFVSDIRQEPDGSLLAWGPDRPSTGGQRLARWSSTDGSTWVRLPQDPAESWDDWCCGGELLGGRYSAANDIAWVWLDGLPYGPNEGRLTAGFAP